MSAGPVLKDLAVEGAVEGLKALVGWLRSRAAKLAKWESIQKRHVERRDLSKDPRPKP